MKPKGNKYTQSGERLPKGQYEFEVLFDIHFDDGRPSTVARMFVVAERAERAVQLAKRSFTKRANFQVERNTGKMFRG